MPEKGGRRGWWQRCTLKIIKTLVIKSVFYFGMKMKRFSWDTTRWNSTYLEVGGGRSWCIWWNTSHHLVYHATLVIFSRINKKTRGNLATKQLPCGASDNKFTKIVFCSRFSSLTQFEKKHLNAKFVLLLTCPSSLKCSKCESDDEARRKRITCRCFFGNINKHLRQFCNEASSRTVEWWIKRTVWGGFERFSLKATNET